MALNSNDRRTPERKVARKLAAKQMAASPVQKAPAPLMLTIPVGGEAVAGWLKEEFPVREDSNMVRIDGGSVVLYPLQRSSGPTASFKLEAAVEWLPDVPYSDGGKEAGVVRQTPMVFGFRQLGPEQVALTLTYPPLAPIESLAKRLVEGIRERWPEIETQISGVPRQREVKSQPNDRY